MTRAAIFGAVLIALSTGAASSQVSPKRWIDVWSGLILLCEVDAKLNAPPDLCSQINTEAARQAAAAKVKFVALAAGDGESGKIAEAKAAGFDDASAQEMVIHLRTSTSTTVIAGLDVDALSRLHPVPVQVAGKPNVFRKIYTQGATFQRDDPNWTQKVAPYAKRMLEIYFEAFLAPPPTKH